MTKIPASVAILGIFVADLAFRASRMPAIGETLLGSGFKMGPGGKGSNQAVAAARAGAKTSFISCLGKDEFGANAMSMFASEGITACIRQSDDLPTGAAFIYVNETSGENAIIVVAGAAGSISAADVDAAADSIRDAKVFITQLEQPIAAALRGLEIARSAGTITIFNPAPAEPFPDSFYGLTDYISPNETEASLLTGITVNSLASARKAADVFLAKGVKTAVITLGDQGALIHNAHISNLVPVFSAGRVVETAGAGDAFNGGFAAALAEGASDMEAVRFGCAVAGISVTRPGTAPSMPSRAEVDALLKS